MNDATKELVEKFSELSSYEHRTRQDGAGREWHKKRMCIGKSHWNSEQGACAFASNIKKQGGERMHAYRCSNCKKWHIGH